MSKPVYLFLISAHSDIFNPRLVLSILSRLDTIFMYISSVAQYLVRLVITLNETKG